MGRARQPLPRLPVHPAMDIFKLTLELRGKLIRKLTGNWVLPGLGLAVVTFDQFTKAWVENHLPLIKRWTILGQNTVVLSRVHNHGLIGGQFSAIPIGYKEIYTRTIPTLCFLCFVLFVRMRSSHNNLRERLFSTALISGGLSNLWDTWTRPYTIDSFQAWAGWQTYIPFNMADFFILIGMIGVVIELCRELWNELCREFYQKTDCDLVRKPYQTS